MPSQLQTYIERFLQDVQRRGSARTARNYRIYLRRFVQLAGCTEISDITAASVESFRTTLQRHRTNRGGLMNAHTINYHLIALRSFVEYLQQHEIEGAPVLEIALLKHAPTRRNMLSMHDISALLAAPLQKKQPEILQQRDAALLELLCSTGLKVSEISQLTRKDIAHDQSRLAVRGLRGTIRTVPLTHQTRYRIGQYLALRDDAAPALFIPHDAAAAHAPRALTPRSIQRIIKKYTQSSDLPPEITPETLRQMYARQQSQRGEDAETIQQRLGLASRATARRYIKN